MRAYSWDLREFHQGLQSTISPKLFSAQESRVSKSCLQETCLRTRCPEVQGDLRSRAVREGERGTQNAIRAVWPGLSQRGFRVRRFPRETVRMGIRHLVALCFDVRCNRDTVSHPPSMEASLDLSECLVGLQAGVSGKPWLRQSAPATLHRLSFAAAAGSWVRFCSGRVR